MVLDADVARVASRSKKAVGADDAGRPDGMEGNAGVRACKQEDGTEEAGRSFREDDVAKKQEERNSGEETSEGSEQGAASKTSDSVAEGSEQGAGEASEQGPTKRQRVGDGPSREDQEA